MYQSQFLHSFGSRRLMRGDEDKDTFRQTSSERRALFPYWEKGYCRYGVPMRDLGDSECRRLGRNEYSLETGALICGINML